MTEVAEKISETCRSFINPLGSHVFHRARIATTVLALPFLVVS